jgi:glutathione S-transferase
MFGLGGGRPKLVVHHLNDSRSQRVLWALEELGLPYEIAPYQRDAATRLAPPELKAVHPLGKSPVLQEGKRMIAESGAILDYLVRRHGKGKLAPPQDTADYDDYVHWMHYPEGSAMLPVLLQLYAARLGEAAAPLQPRIDQEFANHLGYIEQAVSGRDYLIGDHFTAADIQLSFMLQGARAQGKLTGYPAANAYLDRMETRPAFQRSLERGGPYGLAPAPSKS